MANYKSVKENLDFKFRRNEFIRAQEVRVVDEKGESLGIMTSSEALKIAKEREMDLIEIAPQATPPVCKIISWSKFKYEYSKKQKKTIQRSSHIKEMWFKPRTGSGDLEHKIKKIREFLAEKSKVKITIRPGKDRNLDKSFYFDQMNKVLSLLAEEVDVEVAPKVEGKNVYAIIKSRR